MDNICTEEKNEKGIVKLSLEQNKDIKLISQKSQEEVVDIKQEQKEEKKEEEIREIEELKIELFPENKPRNEFIKEPVKNLITKDTKGYSFDINRELAFINKNVPLLNGFFQAYINHYPIRIKPDDIWLLIIQAFSNHVNANSEELRKYFVDFDGKKH